MAPPVKPQTPVTTHSWWVVAAEKSREEWAREVAERQDALSATSGALKAAELATANGFEDRRWREKPSE